MPYETDDSGDLSDRPRRRHSVSGFGDGVPAENAGRKLVDFLAELQHSQQELAPAPLATRGSVQDVLARAAITIPFANGAQRRRRRALRAMMACCAVWMAACVGAAVWMLPGLLTPPGEQAGLSTVVSAAETDLAQVMTALRQVGQVRLAEALPAPSRKPGVSATFSSSAELPAVVRSAPALPVSAIPPTFGGGAVAGTTFLVGASGSGISSASSGPVDEPPTEVPH